MNDKLNARRQREMIDLLLKAGVLTPEMLQKAREESRRTGLKIEKAMEKLGLVQEEDILKIQANALGLPYVNLEQYAIDLKLIQLIPEPTARRN